MKTYSTIRGMLTALGASAAIASASACTTPSKVGSGPAVANTTKAAIPHVCVDRVLPSHMQEGAKVTASTENSRNKPPPGSSSITAMRYKKWLPGRTLHVRFLEGDPGVVGHVKKVAAEWMTYADITLVFDDASNSEIRVAFQQGGSWSNIGTDAKQVDASEATMNYGWLDSETPDDEYSRVVLHEFGHALGFVHEHQNPINEIQWNKEVVYAYYAGEPNKWDRATVDRNIFARYATAETQYTRFDPTSIMEYPIPKEHTLNGFSVGWNKVLSPMDKCYASSVAYPKAGAQPCPP